LLKEDSITRLQWCIDKARAIQENFPSSRKAIAYLSELAKEQFGKAFSKRTLWKYKDHWEWLVGNNQRKNQLGINVEAEQAVPEVPNGDVGYQLEYKDLGPVPDLDIQVVSVPEAEDSISPVVVAMTQQASTPLEYRKGDKVIVNDGTWLPYCGKVATVQARVKDDLGNRCYRLDLDYQGRRGTKARKIEALPQFLKLFPVLTPAASQVAPEHLEATTEQLNAVLGAANPFSGFGKLWWVTPVDIGMQAFRRLREHLHQSSNAYT
jgi:hypothetical protein